MARHSVSVGLDSSLDQPGVYDLVIDKATVESVRNEHGGDVRIRLHLSDPQSFVVRADHVSVGGCVGCSCGPGVEERS